MLGILEYIICKKSLWLNHANNYCKLWSAFRTYPQTPGGAETLRQVVHT